MGTLLEYLPWVLSGLWLTIALAMLSAVIASLLGALGAAAKLSKNPLFRLAGAVYTTLIRGVPDLVLMLLMFFGGQAAINSLGAQTGLWSNVELNPFWAGALTIGFIFGAYMTETFRGAYLAVPRGQTEAAQAIGMTPAHYLRRIIWPQLVPHALPNLTNNWLVLMKTTALVSIIGLQDVVYNANQAGRSTQEPFMFLLVSFFIFLALTILSDVALRKLGKTYAAK